jgi:hypothetical protein
MAPPRAYRAGESLEDFCRACKTDRLHTVMVVDERGRPIRVVCGYCNSEHNYRGGPRVEVSGGPAPSKPVTDTGRMQAPSRRASASVAQDGGSPTEPARRSQPIGQVGKSEPQPERLTLESDRERIAPPMTLPHDTPRDLELLLRRIIREETGLTPVAPAEKWRGGTFVLRPGTPGLQEKSWPIETFFHKVVMVRNRLRTLEQHVNASDLPDDVKVKLQGYVTGCYGSLTSFNILFANDEDQFKGSGD